ncbi:hypothetical protein A3K82_01690 [Candidatus Pacearchaeota archaeon RBG_19FT_COMBO_34_9]|nr:MAG: hypothetical protein A3K82_01690 [Candidatus Pacearchaeota archaeon RBG_19FT_COMBO_34_9]
MKKAMMTFLNSGYKREEIEEAAKALTEPVAEARPQMPAAMRGPAGPVEQRVSAYGTQIPIAPKEEPQIQAKALPEKKPQPVEIYSQPQAQQRVSVYGEQKPVVQQPAFYPVQRVSVYGGERDATEKAIIFILFFLLAFLIGLLILIFIFKQQLIDFFSRFFT